MKKVILVMAGLLLLFATTGFAAEKAAEKPKSKAPTYYVCACGNDCDCNRISTKPGKCKCKKKMEKMHLLGIEGDSASFCECKSGCDCTINKDDPTKCGCGKPVRKVSIKGKYVCSCGPDCACGKISDKPGKCGCGKELKKVE